MMKYSMLRNSRKILAAIVLILSLLIFLLGGRLAVALSRPVLFWQFVPSAVKFLLNAGGIAALGFLLIVVLTLLFGRIYCACLCPLGVLQDGFSLFRRKPRRYQYLAPRPKLRYGLLALVSLTTIAGSLGLLNLLDPYSLFGRISRQIFRPLVILGNNLLASMLGWFDIYTVPRLVLPQFFPALFLITLGMFGLLFWLALHYGRQYCNTLCPVGTILGLLSRFSLYQIRLSAEKCTACMRCEHQCRAGCIDSRHKTLDALRCVTCFDCLTVCPVSALTYEPVFPHSTNVPVNASRRKFLATSLSSIGAILLAGIPLRSLAKSFLSWEQSMLTQADPLRDNVIPIVPPGAESITRFASSCTACHLCVSVCPTHVLQFTGRKYGFQGVLQPTMDYQAGYCDYECTACGQVCPTGAIDLLGLDVKQRVQIGIVKLVTDRCIVYDRKEECGACMEVCPTHAVHAVELDGLQHPQIKAEHCIGCGRCEYVCPVTPTAIFVEGLREHAQALPPLYIEPPQTAPRMQETTDDFPF